LSRTRASLHKYRARPSIVFPRLPRVHLECYFPLYLLKLSCITSPSLTLLQPTPRFVPSLIAFSVPDHLDAAMKLCGGGDVLEGLDLNELDRNTVDKLHCWHGSTES